jgi:hypothetical protein
MSQPNDRIRLDYGDLHSQSVESYLEVRRAMRQSQGEQEPQPLVIRVIYSSWFYLAIASGIGAFAAWACLEPFYDDNIDGGAIEYLLFPTVAGFIGLFLGAAEGLMCRNLSRAMISGVVGLGVGFAGGIVLLFPAGVVFILMNLVAFTVAGDPPDPGEMPTGFALLVFMMGRAAAWAIVSIAAGLGQGIALREKKVILNGAVGGVLGGLLGGLLFDPIYLIFTSEEGEAAVSRGVGFVMIGLLVGLFVGLVEGWTKTAWLHMRAGPLAGKQFVLYRDTTVLGSAPKADVYLFKDAAIEPRHAVIYNRGGRFEIEDCDTGDGTYVNQVPVKRQVLKNGDHIVLGETVLEFVIKELS